MVEKRRKSQPFRSPAERSAAWSADRSAPRSAVGSLSGGQRPGLEAEMSQEDREFEGAKNFVKMAADTVKSAVSAPPASIRLRQQKLAV